MKQVVANVQHLTGLMAESSSGNVNDLLRIL
jgi:hypothetical protein